MVCIGTDQKVRWAEPWSGYGRQSITSVTAVAYPSCTMPIHSIQHKTPQPLSLVAPCPDGAMKAVWSHHTHL